MKATRISLLLCGIMLVFGATRVLGDVTEVRFIVGHADCGYGDASFEFFINATSVGTYAPTQGCICNTSPLVVVLNDPADLALVGIVGCTSVTMDLTDPTSELALGYVRAEIDRDDAATEVYCLVDFMSGGTCQDRDLCDAYGWPGDSSYSNDPPGLDCDEDGVDIPYDNCPDAYNPGQEDADGDGVGDVCDICPGFDDFADVDGDGIPDGCDACPNDPDNDIDGDGVCGDVDNCPRTYNPGQEDSDGDGVGDACPYRPSVDVAIVETNVVRRGGTFPISGGAFDDFNFSFLQVVAVDAASLAPFDTVLLNVGGSTGWGSYCDTGYLASAQKADLLSWVAAGGKLIISDSECPSVDYSWLPYPFTTNNPGQMGAQGTLYITEENVLSTSDPASEYYIDAGALGSQTDAVGDMNVMTTYDANWCLDMAGINYTPAEGPVHTYARYGNGLIIYNGLDMDYLGYSYPAYGLAEIWLQELQVSFNPTPIGDLPCGIAVVGIALTPVSAVNEVGETHTVTATLTDVVGEPQPDVLVTFTVVSGPNAGAAGACDPTDCVTDESGQVNFTYTGSGGVGIDEIEACFINDAAQEVCSQRVTKEWIITTITVDIDIYPNRYPNRIYLSRPYTIYVTVSGSDTFDVTTLNPATVSFGREGTEALPVRPPFFRDLNADGITDAFFGFLTPDCGFQMGDEWGILKGSTTGGVDVEGTDSVVVYP